MTILGTIRPVRSATVAILLWSLSLFAAGCSSSPESAGLALVDSQGNHAASFLVTHPPLAVADVEQCKPCHGDDLAGGISGTSCFTAECHHGTIPGWINPGSHGAAAKRAPGNSGFRSCQICHASDFTGDGSGVSCLNNDACHGAGVQAPHPAKPWRASTGSTHTNNTDPANAPVCAECHFPGSPNNPADHPLDPAPSGTAPDCFNNTLCHGQSAAPHPLGAEWTDPNPSFHGLAAKGDLTDCRSCHSQTGTIAFAGGSAATSCASCHPEARAHPVRWYAAPQGFTTTYVPSHRDAGNRDVACAICHDVTQGRTAPDSGAPSCFSASFNGVSCHENGPGNANHDVPFLNTAHTSVDSGGFTSNCSACHAVSGTSPLASAPLCTVCHQAGSPLTNAGCTSCHAKPPTGSAYPNIANRHAKHDALAGVTNVCTACHAGLDSGTLNHYNRANARPGMDALRTAPGDTAFSATYNGKSGSASFSGAAFTCSNVSCHGGITTPRWDTGTIAGNTNGGCLACHTPGTVLGSPENNSPYSGLHAFHLGSTVNALCTECHDMANGTAGAANHFGFLDTPQMEGPANQTVTFPGLTGATYDSGTQSCTLTCHGQDHGGFTWTGGANHNVPFPETAHTSVDAAGFSGNCSACHFETGTVDDIGPTCTVCHQAGSPLTRFNCTSCHAKPPAGTVYPDIAGRHAGHDALTGVTGLCTTCHNNLDSGTLNHYNRANARPGLNALRVAPGDVAFLTAFNAKSGPASFSESSFTCANVSCHGGLPAPHWRTGTIDEFVDAGCRLCHALGTAQGSPENNSPYSGFHAFHLGSTVNALCTECHDMGNGTTGATNHFGFLNTAQMEGPAGQTVEPDDADPAVAAGTYNGSNRTCTVTCHTQNHSGWRWDGPAADHPLGSAWTDPSPGFHGLTAKSDLTACRTCHSQQGTIAFAGGSATTSCASCHPEARAHPVRWYQAPQDFPTYVPSHRNSGNRDVACAICHDVTQGRAAPDPGAPSCFSASFNNAGCHSGGPGGANHAVPNLEPAHLEAVQADFTGNCSNCHSDTGISPVSSAPNCVSCHTSFSTSNPLTTKDCTSCHGDPPTGSTYPNIARKHAKHNALPEVSTVCSACHNGLDPSIGVAADQLAHYNRAKSKTAPGDVAILSTYNAKNATASFASLSCSNVSCHGGQAVSWDTGSIVVDTDAGCNQCHRRRSISDQWNSQFSGEHGRNQHVNAGCTACHNTTKLADPAAGRHFLALATTVMEVRGSVTIGGGTTRVVTYVPAPSGFTGTCTPQSGGGCHGTETW